jgi:hypothetical protein
LADHVDDQCDDLLSTCWSSSSNGRSRVARIASNVGDPLPDLVTPLFETFLVAEGHPLAAALLEALGLRAPRISSSWAAVINAWERSPIAGIR